MNKEFQLGNLLQRVPTKKMKFKKGDCPISPFNEYNIPARTAATTNQGLSCYVPETEATVLKDVISVSANGDFCAFWHDEKFTILQDAYALEGKGFVLNREIALYIIGAMYTVLAPKYNWNNKSGWGKIKTECITIPVVIDKNGSPIIDDTHFYHEEGFVPDFDYMQEYIEELEQKRIEKLEQYLVVTGLNDYELTDEDIKILSLSGFGDYKDAVKVYKEFKISDLFTKKTIKGYPKVDENLDENPNGYYVYGQNIQRQHPQKVLLDAKYLHIVSEDNPILAYTSSVGEIGMICEPFYRSGDNGAFQGLFSKHHQFNKYELQFILTILRKYFDNFGYTTGMAHIMDLTFLLPIQTDVEGKSIIDVDHKYHPNGYTPDWDFMEKYIKAIEKMVIAPVVKYKDEAIARIKSKVKVKSNA